MAVRFNNNAIHFDRYKLTALALEDRIASILELNSVFIEIYPLLKKLLGARLKFIRTQANSQSMYTLKTVPTSE